MKDEIKEILNKLQKVANRETASRNALMEMKDKDYQLLLDYITNLQKENERLKETQYVWSYDLDMQLEDYKSRIEKAVDYIKNINERAYKDDYGTCFSTYDLLNILQGVDKDE